MFKVLSRIVDVFCLFLECLEGSVGFVVRFCVVLNTVFSAFIVRCKVFERPLNKNVSLSPHFLKHLFSKPRNAAKKTKKPLKTVTF